MQFNIKEIWAHMGPTAIAIAATLLVMAVLSVAIFFERMFVYARSRRRSRAFARTSSALLEKHDYAQVLSLAQTTRGSHLAQLFARGLKTFLAKNSKHSSVAIDMTRKEMERESDRLSTEIKRGLPILATVGSIAPFVGLLGTVVGIINAFQGIAKEGSGGLSAVSGGISESLVETALGLVVAIPVVFFYNLCATRAEELLQGLDHSRDELLDFLEESNAAHTVKTDIALPAHLSHKSGNAHVSAA